tara:strand:- start:991 stop:1146 length:156 start_codon:yes stop_codon:yes gene_type:complete
MKAKEYIKHKTKETHRKTKILEWLVPRFHKGLSDPKNYEKLIGTVEKGGLN